MFIDLRVLFAKLHQPFIKVGVPYTWSGLGVHGLLIGLKLI
jgi:hypothetical protein